ncbi:MAG: efflux RND transporter periplasmic adaptor subunit [Pseudomonadota bacterium]
MHSKPRPWRAANCFCGFLLLILAKVVFAATYEGFTQPYSEAALSLTERGIVTAIHVKEGAMVGAGDLLLELDSSVLEATLAIAKAKQDARGSIVAAQARRDLAQKYFSRLSDLGRDGHAQFDEIAQAEADLAVAKAELQVAREQHGIHKLEVERLRQQIASRKLNAPFGGVVTKIQPKIGEVATIEREPLIHLAQLDHLQIVLYVLAEHIDGIEIGTEVLPKCGSAGQIVEATARIEYISPTIDPDSGTIQVKLSMTNHENALRSGLKCELAL